MDSLIYPKARILNKLLSEQGLKLAVAESCTGGWLSKAITDVSGSSASFYGGLVTYDNKAKINLLNVNPNTIDKHGAVSEQTAAEMVQGLLKQCGVDIGLSITGVAGPASGSDKKPVGTVWFGLIKKDSPVECRKMFFPPGRSHVRGQSVVFALDWLIDSLK